MGSFTLSDRLFVALAKRAGFPTKETLHSCREVQLEWLNTLPTATLFMVAQIEGVIDASQAAQFERWAQQVVVQYPDLKATREQRAPLYSSSSSADRAVRRVIEPPAERLVGPELVNPFAEDPFEASAVHPFETGTIGADAGIVDAFDEPARDIFEESAVDPFASGAVDPFASGAVDPFASGAVDPFASGAVDPFAEAQHEEDDDLFGASLLTDAVSKTEDDDDLFGAANLLDSVPMEDDDLFGASLLTDAVKSADADLLDALIEEHYPEDDEITGDLGLLPDDDDADLLTLSSRGLREMEFPDAEPVSELVLREEDIEFLCEDEITSVHEVDPLADLLGGFEEEKPRAPLPELPPLGLSASQLEFGQSAVSEASDPAGESWRDGDPLEEYATKTRARRQSTPTRTKRAQKQKRRSPRMKSSGGFRAVRRPPSGTGRVTRAARRKRSS